MKPTTMTPEDVKEIEQKKRDHFEKLEPEAVKFAKRIERIVGKDTWFTARQLFAKSRALPGKEVFAAQHIGWLDTYGFIKRKGSMDEEKFLIVTDPEERKHIIRRKQQAFLTNISDFNFVLHSIDYGLFQKIVKAGVASIDKFKWSDTSPDAGDDNCICTLCEAKIGKENTLVRIGHDTESLEIRFHRGCFESITIEREDAGSQEAETNSSEAPSEVQMIPGTDYTYRCTKDFHIAGCEDIDMPLISEGDEGVFQDGVFVFGTVFYTEEEITGKVPVDETLEEKQKQQELDRIQLVASHFERVDL